VFRPIFRNAGDGRNRRRLIGGTDLSYVANPIAGSRLAETAKAIAARDARLPR
jgi:hypothetical protein